MSRYWFENKDLTKTLLNRVSVNKKKIQDNDCGQICGLTFIGLYSSFKSNSQRTGYELTVQK